MFEVAIGCLFLYDGGDLAGGINAWWVENRVGRCGYKTGSGAV